MMQAGRSTSRCVLQREHSISSHGRPPLIAMSTGRMRAATFKALIGDRPIDCYAPIDLQNFVNELQYVPLELSREGKNTEERPTQLGTNYTPVYSGQEQMSVMAAPDRYPQGPKADWCHCLSRAYASTLSHPVRAVGRFEGGKVVRTPEPQSKETRAALVAGPWIRGSSPQKRDPASDWSSPCRDRPLEQTRPM